MHGVCGLATAGLLAIASTCRGAPQPSELLLRDREPAETPELVGYYSWNWGTGSVGPAGASQGRKVAITTRTCCSPGPPAFFS